MQPKGAKQLLEGGEQRRRNEAMTIKVVGVGTVCT